MNTNKQTINIVYVLSQPVIVITLSVLLVTVTRLLENVSVSLTLSGLSVTNVPLTRLISRVDRDVRSAIVILWGLARHPVIRYE